MCIRDRYYTVPGVGRTLLSDAFDFAFRRRIRTQQVKGKGVDRSVRPTLDRSGSESDCAIDKRYRHDYITRIGWPNYASTAMTNLDVVVVLITSDNDYQAEQ